MHFLKANSTIPLYSIQKYFRNSRYLDSSGKASIQNNGGHPSPITDILYIILNLNLFPKSAFRINVFLILINLWNIFSISVFITFYI